jgi:hypothetical protein
VGITKTPREGEYRDAMLAELTQAFEQITRATREPARPHESAFTRTARQLWEQPALAAILERLSLPGVLRSWSLIGLLAVACIGAIVIAWPSSDVRAVKSTTPSGADAARTDPGVQQPLAQPQTTAPGAGPTATPIAPELTQWGQTIARELATLEQGIELLKTSQAQLARDNADLAGHLKETQDEIAQHDAELAEGRKAAQEEMVRENLNLTAQLKASQEQIAAFGEQLKATQEHVDRLGAPKQPPRPTKSTSPASLRPNASPAPKPAHRPVPKSSSAQAGPFPKNSMQQ